MFGIDVSHYQGSIDWSLILQNTPKVDFAFIKASTGVGSTDSKFHFNSNEAKKYGLKIGYYHFSSLNNINVQVDAKSEAEWFLQTIKVGPSPDLPLVLDIESEDPRIQLNHDDVLLWIKTFFSTLEANGYKNYAIYSYTSFLDQHLPTTHELGNIPIWIAAYTNRPSPKLPLGWNSYWIWQYSSNGHVKGINTNVDLNKSLNNL